MKEEIVYKYLGTLMEIGERIKEAQKENKPEVVRQWFYYLQGYIQALNYLPIKKK